MSEKPMPDHESEGRAKRRRWEVECQVPGRRHWERFSSIKYSTGERALLAAREHERSGYYRGYIFRAREKASTDAA